MLISFKQKKMKRKNEGRRSREIFRRASERGRQKNEILSCDTYSVDILACQNAEDRCGYEQQHMVNDKFTEISIPSIQPFKCI